MVTLKSFQNGITSLWADRCDICVLANVTVSRTGKTHQEWQPLYSALPCRLSFKNVTIPTETDSAARTVQSTKLFLDKDVDVPPGSKIIVTHENVKREYSQSGVPAVYSYHQEIPIELCGEWA